MGAVPDGDEVLARSKSKDTATGGWGGRRKRRSEGGGEGEGEGKGKEQRNMLFVSGMMGVKRNRLGTLRYGLVSFATPVGVAVAVGGGWLFFISCFSILRIVDCPTAAKYCLLVYVYLLLAFLPCLCSPDARSKCKCVLFIDTFFSRLMSVPHLHCVEPAVLLYHQRPHLTLQVLL